MKNPAASTKRGGQRRHLIGPLLRREIRIRHKGTFGGLYWYVIQNVIIVIIYSTVFGTILRGIWREEGLEEINFTIVLFVGLIQYNLLSEILIRAPLLIVQNANLVTKVVFPLETLPVVLVGVSMFNALVAFCVLLFAALVLNVSLSWNGLWLPIIVAPLALGALGLAWILAALGTYIRDVGQVVALTVTAMMFLSPLFYPIGVLPEGLKMLVAFNPITVPIQEARAVLVFGQDPNFVALGFYWLAALILALVGRWSFDRMRGGFADVV